MDKKDGKGQRPQPKLMNSQIMPEVRTLGPQPEVVEKLTIGRADSAKAFMEADLERLRCSMKMDQIKPKLHMLEEDMLVRAKADLRTGNADLRATLPKTADIEDSRIPVHPKLALEAAMKKLERKTLR